MELGDDLEEPIRQALGITQPSSIVRSAEGTALFNTNGSQRRNGDQAPASRPEHTGEADLQEPPDSE